MMNLQEASPLLRQEPPEFSLVLGGPLYQLWRRTRLTGDALELMRRRILAMAFLTWVPLLVLSIAEGLFWGDGIQPTAFLMDEPTDCNRDIACGA
jgi:hypothetical protein